MKNEIFNITKHDDRMTTAVLLQLCCGRCLTLLFCNFCAWVNMKYLVYASANGVSVVLVVVAVCVYDVRVRLYCTLEIMRFICGFMCVGESLHAFCACVFFIWLACCSCCSATSSAQCTSAMHALVSKLQTTNAPLLKNEHRKNFSQISCVVRALRWMQIKRKWENTYVGISFGLFWKVCLCSYVMSENGSFRSKSGHL